MERLEEKYLFDGFEKSKYLKYKSKLEDELMECNSKLNKVDGELSNHLDYLDNVVSISQNLSKYWSLGSYPVKDKIQRAVFPEGLVINPSKRQYLTKNINKLFRISSTESGGMEDIETKKVGENTDLSCQVAGTRLERATFGL